MSLSTHLVSIQLAIIAHQLPFEQSLILVFILSVHKDTLSWDTQLAETQLRKTVFLRAWVNLPSEHA